MSSLIKVFNTHATPGEQFYLLLVREERFHLIHLCTSQLKKDRPWTPTEAGSGTGLVTTILTQIRKKYQLAAYLMYFERVGDVVPHIV